MNREQKHISDKLYKLIYQPKLIPDWRGFPVHLKLFMFQNYFLLLNKTFQEEFGEQLEKWFTVFTVRPFEKSIDLFISLWPEDNLPLCKRQTLPRSGNEELVKKFNAGFLTNLIERTPRNKINKYNLQLYQSVTSEDHLFPTSVFESGERYVPLISYDKNVKKEEDNALVCFNEYIQERREGNIPDVVYLGVKLYRPEKELLEDFKNIMSELQEKYFQKYPDNKAPEFGHIGYKKDLRSKKRPKSYPFDEWERYFKVYVMFELGKKQREIARQFFPQDAVGTGEGKISQDLKKARKLIKNAWEGDFPGKYY